MVCEAVKHTNKLQDTHSEHKNMYHQRTISPLIATQLYNGTTRALISIYCFRSSNLKFLKSNS